MKIDDKMIVAIDADTSGFDKAMGDITKSSQQFSRAFTSSIKQAVIGGKGLEDTLRNIGMRFADIALNQAFAPLENMFANFIGNLAAGASTGPTAFAKGGMFNATGVVPFAKGGVVSSPSYFDFKGGRGLMGEAGAEAIMPLSRGPDGKLGVASSGQSARPVQVVFNVASNDPQSFRRSEGQISAMLARAVQRGNRAL